MQRKEPTPEFSTFYLLSFVRNMRRVLSFSNFPFKFKIRLIGFTPTYLQFWAKGTDPGGEMSELHKKVIM